MTEQASVEIEAFALVRRAGENLNLPLDVIEGTIERLRAAYVGEIWMFLAMDRTHYAEMGIQCDLEEEIKRLTRNIID